MAKSRTYCCEGQGCAQPWADPAPPPGRDSSLDVRTAAKPPARLGTRGTNGIAHKDRNFGPQTTVWQKFEEKLPLFKWTRTRGKGLQLEQELLLREAPGTTLGEAPGREQDLSRTGAVPLLPSGQDLAWCHCPLACTAPWPPECHQQAGHAPRMSSLALWMEQAGHKASAVWDHPGVILYPWKGTSRQDRHCSVLGAGCSQGLCQRSTDQNQIFHTPSTNSAFTPLTQYSCQTPTSIKDLWAQIHIIKETLRSPKAKRKTYWGTKSQVYLTSLKSHVYFCQDWKKNKFLKAALLKSKLSPRLQQHFLIAIHEVHFLVCKSSVSANRLKHVWLVSLPKPSEFASHM